MNGRESISGKTVQVVPHIIDAIQDKVRDVAHKPVEAATSVSEDLTPQVCVIELGGTVGDIESMPFVEAFRAFHQKVGAQNFCSVHVSLVPEIFGEHKTKPTQNGVKELRSAGLMPDMVWCQELPWVDGN